MLIWAVGILIFVVEKHPHAQEKPSEKETMESCPLSTPKDWQKFLEKTANNENWVETCEDSTCNKAFYNKVTNNVDAVLKKCKSIISTDIQIASCTENLRMFLPAWMRQHDSVSYGFKVDNHTYLTDQESADKPPGMMKIPDTIVAALPDQRKVQEVARKNGWKYLTHDSAIEGVRTFIYIPDPLQRFDQWMLLNLKGPFDKKISQGMPVSIVGVQKKTASGQELSKIRLHFRDYNIENQGSYVKLTVNENGNGKCYSCHTSGLRQLIPRRTRVLEARPVHGEPGFNQPVAADFAYQRLTEFNKTIRRYGPNDWDGKIIPEEHGPMLGHNEGCILCHNGESRGILTVSTSIAQLHQKITAELSMPPSENLIRYIERFEMKNPALSKKEREELKRAVYESIDLTNQFMSSRYPELRDWLLKKSCL
ncbi:MAG: hypothetical protein ACXWRE_05070 [Pseudobdellovibrionaceae bacterium]